MNYEWGYENYLNEAEEELALELETDEWQPETDELYEADELYETGYRTGNRRRSPSYGGRGRRQHQVVRCDEFVNFALNKSAIPPGEYPRIQEVARRIIASLKSRSPVLAVRLRGHTDQSGSDDYNLRLGQRRAQNVTLQLKKDLERQQPGSSSRVRFIITSSGESQATSAYDAGSRGVEICLIRLQHHVQDPPTDPVPDWQPPQHCPPCPQPGCRCGGGNMQCFIAVERTIFTAIRNLKAVAAACRRKSHGGSGGSCGRRR